MVKVDLEKEETLVADARERQPVCEEKRTTGGRRVDDEKT